MPTVTADPESLTARRARFDKSSTARVRHRRPTIDHSRPLRGQSIRPRVYVPDEPGMYAGIASWHSRDRWLGRLTAWLLSAAADEICRRHRLIDRAKILFVAGVLADHADHDTGRRCAPSYGTVATLAGVAVSTVRRTEAILRDGGWLKVVWNAGYLTTAQRAEALELTGRRQVRSGNVRALTIPREQVRQLADEPSEQTPDSELSTRHEHQPTSGRSDLSSSGRQTKTTRASARGPATRPKNPAPTKRAPRPMPVQLLAAAVVDKLPALLAGNRHVGAVCDAISWASIELHRWGPTPTRAAARLVEALHRALPIFKALRSPIGWLHSALQRIDPAEPTPWELEQQEAEQRRVAQAAFAAQAAAERAAAVPLDQSSAAAQIRAELRRIAQKPRPSKPTPYIPPQR